MKYNQDSIVVELAGKDSIASMIDFAMKNKNQYFLPTVIRIPPEENRYEDLFKYYENLQDYVEKLGSRMYEPLILDSEQLWWKVNYPISNLIKEYGFYAPCIACHALLHAIRVPIAQNYSKKIITGERLFHNGKIKINQNSLVLNIFDLWFKEHQVEMIRPFEHQNDTEQINSILNEFYMTYDIKNIEYIKCHLSNNFKVENEEELSQYKIESYCNNYLIPELNNIIKILQDQTIYE